MPDVETSQNDAHSSESKPTEKIPETTFTLRHPPYTYMHLTVKTLSSTALVDIDKVTAQSYLHAALSQFLGLTGTAIRLDVLKVAGREIWVRVPTGDAGAVVAAVSQWAGIGQGVSLRVKARGTWLGGVMGRGGMSERLWTMEK